MKQNKNTTKEKTDWENSIRILTMGGLKTLNDEQYELYKNIWSSYHQKRYKDARALLQEWESKYPHLQSHWFFYVKNIKSGNYTKWVDPKEVKDYMNKLQEMWYEAKLKL